MAGDPRPPELTVAALVDAGAFDWLAARFRDRGAAELLLVQFGIPRHEVRNFDHFSLPGRFWREHAGLVHSGQVVFRSGDRAVALTLRDFVAFFAEMSLRIGELTTPYLDLAKTHTIPLWVNQPFDFSVRPEHQFDDLMKSSLYASRDHRWDITRTPGGDYILPLLVGGDPGGREFRRHLAALDRAVRWGNRRLARVRPPVLLAADRDPAHLVQDNPALIYLTTVLGAAARDRKATSRAVRRLLEARLPGRPVVLNGLFPHAELADVIGAAGGVLSTHPAILPDEAVRVAYHLARRIVGRRESPEAAVERARLAVQRLWDRNMNLSSATLRAFGHPTVSPTLNDLVVLTTGQLLRPPPA